MTTEEKIEALLFNSVALLDIEGSPPYAWPNSDFPGEDSMPAIYIAVSHLPNQNTRLFSKGSDPHLRQGILQLVVVAPVGNGASQATSLAGAIASQYPADYNLYDGSTRLRIQAAPDVRPAEKDDVSWNVRVSIRYECFG